MSEQGGETSAVPLLVEVGLTLWRLVVALVPAGTFALSLLSGATLWDATLRGAAAILTLGLLGWAVNWMVARGALAALADALNEAMAQSAGSTQEWQA